jgi:hypothetical protein
VLSKVCLSSPCAHPIPSQPIPSMPGWYVSAPCRSFPASDPSPSLQATSTKTTTTTHLLHPLTVIFLSQFRSSRQHCHFFVLLFLLSSHIFALFINEQKASNKVAISELQGTAYFRSPDLVSRAHLQTPISDSTHHPTPGHFRLTRTTCARPITTRRTNPH